MCLPALAWLECKWRIIRDGVLHLRDGWSI